MDDRLRTSDADRDRAAALLRDHFAAGRLDAAELDGRLAVALNAKTFGELRSVLADLPESGQARQPGRVPPDRGGLERGYRWLLACYPAAYRSVHEEEMLAVLMTAAPRGHRRPRIGEAADLIWGAVRVRCQPSRTGAAPAWRDALAAVSVLLPVIVLTTTAVQVAVAWPVLLHWSQISTAGAPNAFWTTAPQWLLFQFAAPLALLALALLALAPRRLQGLAALTAIGGLLWLGQLPGLPGAGFAYLAVNPYIVLAVGLQIVAVTASTGPRRGLRLLTWKHVALTVIAAAAVATTTYPLTLVVIAVICAAMALTSSLGRSVLVLLAIPLGPYVAFPWRLGGLSGWQMRVYLPPLMSPDTLGTIGRAYAPAAVSLGVFVIAAWRESLRSRRLAPPSR